MILKEIEMDIPYKKKEGMSYEESINDYEKTWESKRIKFGLMTRCMTAMIERLIPRIELPETRKVLIECVTSITREQAIDLLGVCVVQVLFDVDAFFKMNDYQKKQYAITKILEALNVLEAKKQYDLEEVKKACEIIIQNDYVNEWYWKKSLRRKHKVAQVKVLHNVDFVSIYIIVSDNQEKK